MCGGLSVIGDLYKTEVYELCRYINRKKEIIPENILSKAPSAELRPGQKDSDSLQGGYDETLVNRILSMVNRNEYKRKQLSPVLRISSKAFGLGRRMPIVGKYLS